MNENPYQSPLADETFTDKSRSRTEGNSILVLARPIFLDWERLRVAYILFLGPFTLLLAGWQAYQPEVMLEIVAGGVLANICFFAGPLLETYVRWLGGRGIWLRWILFAIGTLFTAFLAVLVVAKQTS